ncbi:hypothetical protein GGR57DRAFT_507073 [Xylariaceae sp. FL1272]|nr:hypothetical protein GGR57DRAFT_507073 [Xylariaceae sp. FL1272]
MPRYTHPIDPEVWEAERTARLDPDRPRLTRYAGPCIRPRHEVTTEWLIESFWAPGTPMPGTATEEELRKPIRYKETDGLDKKWIHVVIDLEGSLRHTKASIPRLVPKTGYADPDKLSRLILVNGEWPSSIGVYTYDSADADKTVKSKHKRPGRPRNRDPLGPGPYGEQIIPLGKCYHWVVTETAADMHPDNRRKFAKQLTEVCENRYTDLQWFVKGIDDLFYDLTYRNLTPEQITQGIKRPIVLYGWGINRENDFFADSSLNLGHRVRAFVDLQLWTLPYTVFDPKHRSHLGNKLGHGHFLDSIGIRHCRPQVAPGQPLFQRAGSQGVVAAPTVQSSSQPALTWSREDNLHNAIHDAYTEFVGMCTLLFMPKGVYQKWQAREPIPIRNWPGFSIEQRFGFMQENEKTFRDQIQRSRDFNRQRMPDEKDERVDNRQPPLEILGDGEKEQGKREKRKARDDAGANDGRGAPNKKVRW